MISLKQIKIVFLLCAFAWVALNTSFADVTTEVLEPVNIEFQLGRKSALINGVETDLIAAPVVISGRTLLPVRIIAQEVLGAHVVYDPLSKQVAITKNGSKIRLVLGSKEAFVNGEIYELDVAASVIDGTTFLPVRFLSEQFGLNVQYNSESKTLVIGGANAQLPPPNQPPIAQFYFATDFIAGQAVQVVDESTDPEGDPLVARQWMINGDSNLVASSLGAIFSRPKAGNYLISMKVKDAKGNWSEWSSAPVAITENKAPQVVRITSQKAEYQKGELIDYAVAYDNESWEAVVREKWSYKKLGDNVSQPIYAKPKRIFDEGTYLVMLQIQDEYGQWSPKYESQVVINAQTSFKEFAFKFNNGDLGETIANFSNIDFLSYKDAPKVQVEGEPGTLFFSNSPEKVKQKGILYEDQILGKGRALIHHIHDFEDSEQKRLVVMAYNDTDAPIVLTLSNMTMLDPGSDILYLGQQLLHRYFEGSGQKVVEIPAQGSLLLYESNGSKWVKGTALSGIFDFQTDQPLRLVVGAIDRSEPLENVGMYAYPVRDVHPRGTFVTLNERIYVDLSETQEPVKIQVGKFQEEWLVGQDAITKQVVTNRGNYGLEYHIQVTAKTRTAVIINPRGAIYNGAIKWVGGPTFLAPSDGFFVGGKTRAAFLGVVEAGQTKEFIYMLPNGSAAPVLFAFIPEAYWR